MSLAEETRHFQVALEAQRRAESEFAGVVSALDILDGASEYVAKARAAMERAWLAEGLPWRDELCDCMNPFLIRPIRTPHGLQCGYCKGALT